MTGVQWARLESEAGIPLRRGAWYRILRAGPAEVVLEVNHKPMPVPRNAVKILPAVPLRWTVVASPRHSNRYPTSWGQQYGVCPSCRERASLEGASSNLRCPRCNGLFEIAWNEGYTVSA
jgi:hypothetical protein